MAISLMNPEQSSQALWFLTRGSGVVSLVLLTAVMVLGILPRAKLVTAKPSRLFSGGLHRTLSLLALAFISIHVLATVVDGYAPIRLVDAVIPFISSYRPIWLGLGAVAFDLFIALTLTSMMRSRVGPRTWRVVHWASYACWPAAVLHVFGAGSDADEVWMLALVIACVVAVLIALEMRVVRARNQSAGIRYATVAVTLAAILAITTWVVSGPLRPGWAVSAGTPPDLAGGSSGSDCLGGSCDQQRLAAANPFCAVPKPAFGLLLSGYRAERSADMFLLTEEPQIIGSAPERPGSAPSWTSMQSPAATRVPLAFVGGGVPRGELGAAALADVAPTLARITGTRWPFPQYLEGRVLDGFVQTKSPLVVVVAWKGVGSDDLEAEAEAWPFVASLGETGSFSLDAHTGSLPVDSSAVLTTVGTGTLPSTHGITGTTVRVPSGRIVTAWEKGAPASVTIALGDVLDDENHGESLVGAVLTEPFDRGIIGGTWFVGLGQPDDDDVRVAESDQVASTVADLLSKGYGEDEVPDLLGVTLEGDVTDMDRATAQIASATRRFGGPGAVLVVLGTGSGSASVSDPIPASSIQAAVEDSLGEGSVLSAGPDGIFLDWRLLESLDANSSAALTKLREGEGVLDPPPLAYSGLSIAFGASCPGSGIAPSPTEAPMPEMEM